jgi:hypothetical protein
MSNAHGIAKEFDMFVPFKVVINVAIRAPTPYWTTPGAMPFALGTFDRLIVQPATHDIGGRR